LQQIVRERMDTLWDMGIAGADLVISCVGAGLRAFTKYEEVEYANGEEVPAEKFLAEVEGTVLDKMMEKLFERRAHPEKRAPIKRSMSNGEETKPKAARLAQPYLDQSGGLLRQAVHQRNAHLDIVDPGFSRGRDAD
jgi:adenine-specific DNA methylase